MALWYTKSVESLLLSNESTKTTETHVQIFVCFFFKNNLQYSMEVQAYCQALIRDANRSCYLHHCKRSSVTFCNKNNLLSGGSRVFQDKTDASCRRYSFNVRQPDSKADRKGKLRVVWISMYFQSDIPLKIGLFGFVNSPTHRWKHPAFFGLT